MNDKHIPKGSPQGGQFAPKDGNYIDDVNERIQWAKNNDVELPLNNDGSEMIRS